MRRGPDWVRSCPACSTPCPRQHVIKQLAQERRNREERGIGLFKDNSDIANVAVTAKNGIPVYLKQLGEVSVGARVPIGRVGKDEESDIVQGVVLMRRGEKSLPTLERVRQKVAQLNNGILPKGVWIVPYYDRTNLIDITTHTVTHTLLEGMVLVALILLAFLGDLRASLVVALSIPLSLLFTFIVMVLRGDSANLISMGAIDFGIIVDASVVMVENIHRHLCEPNPFRDDIRRTTIRAAQEVSKPIFFSSAIIVAAFLPLFTMNGRARPSTPTTRAEPKTGSPPIERENLTAPTSPAAGTTAPSSRSARSS